MRDVIIVGAGMAGLGAALALKKRGIPYLLLEAGEEAGGRGATRRLPSGLCVDMGAHWLHGKTNPLRALLKKYHIPYSRDKAERLWIYQHGKVTKSKRDEWLDKALNAAKAKRVEQGSARDCPITRLAANAKGRALLADFSLMWNGIDPPVEPSAHEFLTDKSTPGGLQPVGGMGRLIGAMMEDAGAAHMRFNTPVTSIRQHKNTVQLFGENAKTWDAKAVIFTASAAVIDSGLVGFDPPISREMREYLAGLVLGKMNKIIIELAPEFFTQRRIANDMSMELLDAQPPHFCHIRSAGLPLINLFVSGSQAEYVERLQPRELLAYVKKILAPVSEISGFEREVIGEPVVSGWIANPYTRCSYFSCLPGAKRRGPILDGKVFFCGDSFDDTYPASLAGAFLSGKKAAQRAAKLIVK